jgi:hypothetical protein
MPISRSSAVTGRLDHRVFEGVFGGDHAADVGTASSGDWRAGATATGSAEPHQFAGLVVTNRGQGAQGAVDGNACATAEWHLSVSRGDATHGSDGHGETHRDRHDVS